MSQVLPAPPAAPTPAPAVRPPVRAAASERPARPLVTAAALVIVVAGLKAAAELCVPFVLALFLALMSWPLLAGLKRRGLPPWAAVGLTVALDVGLLAALVLLLAAAAVDFREALPLYFERLAARLTNLVEWAEGQGLPVAVWQGGERNVPALMGMAGDLVRITVKSVAAFFGYFTVVLFAVVFMLAEGTVLPGKFAAAFGSRALAPAEWLAISADLQRYLGIKTAISAAAGLTIGAWLWLLDLEFALLWALVAFLFHYVPIVGSILAALPPVLLTWAADGFGRAALVAAAYLAVNMVLGNVVEPQWMGKRFGLSTLVVFAALSFWGYVWGPVGMLLSVPLTMGVKILLERSTGLRWAAVLLGKGAPLAVRDPAGG